MDKELLEKLLEETKADMEMNQEELRGLKDRYSKNKERFNFELKLLREWADESGLESDIQEELEEQVDSVRRAVDGMDEDITFKQTLIKTDEFKMKKIEEQLKASE